MRIVLSYIKEGTFMVTTPTFPSMSSLDPSSVIAEVLWETCPVIG